MGNPQNSAETKSDYSQLVPAVEQATQILLALARQQSGKMSLTEVCKTVGIHNSKGYSILNTLQKFALVQRDPETKAYSLGLGLVFLSQRVLDTLDLRQAERFRPCQNRQRLCRPGRAGISRSQWHCGSDRPQWPL